MSLFYAPEAVQDASMISLPDEEAHHALHVLRLRVGDAVQVTNGKGLLLQGHIHSAGKRQCVVEATGILPAAPQPVDLHIAIAPTKNHDRIEWFTEKCVEMGIGTITFIRCRHSERKRVKTERILRTAVSAMKQSQQAWLPAIGALTDFATLVTSIPPETAKYIAYQDTDNRHLKDHKQESGKYCILIGPEGDFSEEEIALARQHGFQPVLLGRNRLRTETAGIVACMIVNMLHDV